MSDAGSHKEEIMESSNGNNASKSSAENLYVEHEQKENIMEEKEDNQSQSSIVKDAIESNKTISVSDLQVETDELYGTLDMESTTVKHFVKILEKRRNGKLSRELRLLVKQRVKELVETEIVDDNEKKDIIEDEKEENGDEVSDVDSDDESYSEDKEEGHKLLSSNQISSRRLPPFVKGKAPKGSSHRRMMEIQREELRSLEIQEQQKLSAADEARAKVIQARLDTSSCIDFELRGKVMHNLVKLRGEVRSAKEENSRDNEVHMPFTNDRSRSEEEESDDDFELEIVNDPNAQILEGMLHINVDGRTSKTVDDAKQKQHPTSRISPYKKAPSNPRLALKLELRRKRIQASNTWLAR